MNLTPGDVIAILALALTTVALVGGGVWTVGTLRATLSKLTGAVERLEQTVERLIRLDDHKEERISDLDKRLSVIEAGKEVAL